MECAELDCSQPAAVRLHVPWDENRVVCAAHGRVLAQQDGVVADPLEDSDGDWP
ncbi:hypothetical protein [Halorussus lipolyticus]|uniref:hypothetical protein n=1 Tax=Halorussus lipolyticus TaxID=3034024 RepID=UPI0023E76D26|nr:hypothetical protein [Halorussus sp. DT80]